MKTRKSSFAICGIVVLLGIGYVIPTIVMQLKDWSLKNEQKEIEIEKIQLQTVDLVEELSVFPEMFSNQIIVEVGDGFEKNNDEEMQEVGASVKKNLYSDVQKFLTMLDTKEEVVLQNFYAQNYAMMVSMKDERVYSIWVCVGIDERGEEYFFWVDATLNKVMAFDVPFSLFGNSEEAFSSAMNRLINYYDFTVYGSFAYTYAASNMGELIKSKYWQNDLVILDKPGNEMLSLSIYKNADRFLFNVNPGDISVSYDVEYYFVD